MASPENDGFEEAALPSASLPLVLEHMPGTLSKVAYRHSDSGELFWDVMHLGDMLGEQSQSVLKHCTELCSGDVAISRGLSKADLHKRGKRCRQGLLCCTFCHAV